MTANHRAGRYHYKPMRIQISKDVNCLRVRDCQWPSYRCFEVWIGLVERLGQSQSGIRQNQYFSDTWLKIAPALIQTETVTENQEEMSSLLRASGCDSKTCVLKLYSDDGMIGGFSSGRLTLNSDVDSGTYHVVYYDNLLTFLDQDGVKTPLHLHLVLFL